MRSDELYVKLDTIKLALDSAGPLMTAKTGSGDVDRMAEQVTISALNKLNTLLTEVYINGVENEDEDEDED